jgi:hypothetical protein
MYKSKVEKVWRFCFSCFQCTLVIRNFSASICITPELNNYTCYGTFFHLLYFLSE